MASDSFRNPERDSKNTQEGKTICSPLGMIKSSIGSVSRWWRPERDSRTSEPAPEKKYVHTPTHAASSFLKTTTTRSMQSANEIL
ncbi:hypothetical protein MMYC01_201787 [Madurella mycetomatis]|uniref:Uncharacterized protein n=1 Tax=Madurella mycetomatis TaxID=100816 RepID=A0A175WEW0_9PEZI|nr:hypothetical protein MMYC01_201787 [Madurella mycetomatis]